MDREPAAKRARCLYRVRPIVVPHRQGRQGLQVYYVVVLVHDMKTGQTKPTSGRQQLARTREI